MSRIGNQPIPVPDAVQVEVGTRELKIKGPRGELTTPVPEGIRFELQDGELVASRDDDQKRTRSLHGLARSLAANAVAGVTDGFSIDLEIRGIGYRAAVQGKSLNLQLGFSHPVEFAIPAGVEITTPDQTKIHVEGADKQQVGEVAAQLRRIRPPDAYKGKGIRYADEVVHTKVGKAGVSTTL